MSARWLLACDMTGCGNTYPIGTTNDELGRKDAAGKGWLLVSMAFAHGGRSRDFCPVCSPAVLKSLCAVT